MSLDHDLDNLPRLSDEDREALDNPYIVIPSIMSDEAIARRNAATSQEQAADDDEFESLKQRIKQLKQLESAMEDRDFKEVLVYRTICAAIILLDDDKDVGMVTDMLRLARDSMTNAKELTSLHTEAAEVSHG